MIGTTLSHYRITEKLGAGGMGVVYRAEDTNLNRQVAIKVLPDIFSGDPERLARFEREAKLLASLNHPNIATIYGLEQADGKRFLAMELVEGETLAQRIAKGPLPVDEALDVCRQIAEGLDAAHEKGVIHRDLKPANVKITPEGKVKVLDFGLAKAFQGEIAAADASHSPTLTDQMTRPGVILGTAAYMSPEQAKGKTVDKRTDIWAFGCVLYECLTGKRAFEGETVTETLASILKGEPDWNLIPAILPVTVRRMLSRCLQKDPRKRLGAISDARLEIEDALAAPMTVDGNAGLLAPPAVNWGLGKLIWLAMAMVALTASLFLGKFLGAPNNTQSMVRRFSISIPPQQALVDTGGVPVQITADGSAIIYTGRGPKGSQLYFRRLDQLEGKPIPGTENAVGPKISPSGEWIAFAAPDTKTATHRNIMKVALNGGAPVFLCSTSWVGMCWGSENTI